MKLPATIISVIASPLVISILLCYALVFKSRGDVVFALQWSFISVLFVLLVGLFVLYGVKRGFFSDFDVSKRSERPPLFAFTAFISILYLVIILVFNGPRVLLIGLGSLLFGVLVATFVNQKIKASMHLAIFTAFVIVMGILYGGLFWFLILLIPMVAWSRITLKRHTPKEALVGTIIGAVLVILFFCIVKYLII